VAASCPKCGSWSKRLVEIGAAGRVVYGCLGCGAEIQVLKPHRFETILREHQVSPSHEPDVVTEAAKISRLRALRLANAADHLHGRSSRSNRQP